MKIFYKIVTLLPIFLVINPVLGSSCQNTNAENASFEDVLPVIKEFCPVCLGNGHDLFDLQKIDEFYYDVSEDASEEELSESNEDESENESSENSDNTKTMEEVIEGKTRKYTILFRLDEMVNHCAACRQHPESLSILLSTASNVLAKFKKGETFSADADKNYETLHKGLSEVLMANLKIPLKLFIEGLNEVGFGSKKKYKLDYCKNNHNLWFLNEK